MENKITVRVPLELARGFDAFLKSDPDASKTRQEAMRFILHDWLSEKGFLDRPCKKGNDT